MQKITEDQGARLRGARGLPTSQAKSARKRVWAEIRAQHRVPTDVKLKVEVDSRDDPTFLALKDRCTGQLLGVGTYDQLPEAEAYSTQNHTGRQPAAAAAPMLRYGSLALDDAMALLRSDGDTYDTFADAHAPARANVYVEGNRLFFLL